MKQLSSTARAALKRQAHTLQPTVRIGKGSLSPQVVAQADKALDDHELIKVKFVAQKEERREISIQLAQACDAYMVDVIGNTAILFKPAKDKKDRKISLS